MEFSAEARGRAYRWEARLRRITEQLRAQSKRRHNVTVGRGARCGPRSRVTAAPGSYISIGARAEIGAGSTLASFATGELVIARGVAIAHGCTIAAFERVTIGENAMLAEYVSVRDHDHDPAHAPKDGPMLVDAVEIGADTWLAAKVTVCRGASVGAGSVVGANAVVTRPLPAGVLAAGAPATVRRALDRSGDSQTRARPVR